MSNHYTGAVPPALICFDLGGVVVRLREDLEGMCEASGVPLREAVEPATLLMHPVALGYHAGHVGFAEFCNGISDAVDNLYSPAEVAQLHAARIAGEYPDVAELVAALDFAGTETAVLSNTNAEHWRVMVEWPALRAMRHLFASHIIGANKPATEAYAVVERETGVAAEQILFFDDSIVNVEAATQRGWHAYHVSPVQPPAAQMREVLIGAGVPLG